MNLKLRKISKEKKSGNDKNSTIGILNPWLQGPQLCQQCDAVSLGDNPTA